MKTIITYIAEDGTPFENERECYDYEQKMKFDKIKTMFTWLDSNFKPLAKDGNVGDAFNYIIVYDEKAFEILNEWFKYNGFYNFEITETGIYYWDDDIEQFLHLDSEIEKLNKLKESILKGAEE